MLINAHVFYMENVVICVAKQLDYIYACFMGYCERRFHEQVSTREEECLTIVEVCNSH